MSHFAEEYHLDLAAGRDPNKKAIIPFRIMNQLDYWKECISLAAEDCGLVMTAAQLEELAGSVKVGHENYGMAFYSPSAHERMDDIEKEWKSKLKDKDQELERYRANAEKAVKRALRQPSDANVSIGEYGEVNRYDGRTSRIQ